MKFEFNKIMERWISTHNQDSSLHKVRSQTVPAQGKLSSISWNLIDAQHRSLNVTNKFLKYEKYNISTMQGKLVILVSTQLKTLSTL